jgi:hypothetical protein
MIDMPLATLDRCNRESAMLFAAPAHASAKL